MAEPFLRPPSSFLGRVLVSSQKTIKAHIINCWSLLENKDGMSDNHYSHSSRANSSLFLITCLYRAITAISFANSEFIAPEKWYYNILYVCFSI